MSDADNDAEQRLAVLTSWALFGTLSLGLVASAFRADDFFVACAGYVVLVGGFISHIIINRIYGRDFRPGEIVTAITLLGVATLAFMATWAFDPGFSATDVESGILGLVVAVACFGVYLASRHGLTGAFSMFHTDRDT